MITDYQVAYAQYAEFMRAKWRGRPARECNYARGDIARTMPHHPIDGAYMGKLYAELDAIRDRMMALNT